MYVFNVYRHNDRAICMYDIACVQCVGMMYIHVHVHVGLCNVCMTLHVYNV